MQKYIPHHCKSEIKKRNSSYYIDYNSGNNKRVPKFEVNDDLEISKYKSTFGNFDDQNEEIFVVKEVKNVRNENLMISQSKICMT